MRGSSSAKSHGFRRPTAEPATPPSPPRRREEIVDLDIRGQTPVAGAQPIADAGHFDWVQPVAAQPEDQFGRPHKLAPVMRAARQPAQHVFGADDRQRKGSRGAVERRGDQTRRPDATSAVRRRRKASRSATCSITSSARTASKRSPKPVSDFDGRDAIVDVETPGRARVLARPRSRRRRRRSRSPQSRAAPSARRRARRRSRHRSRRRPAKGCSDPVSRPKWSHEPLADEAEPRRVEPVQRRGSCPPDPTRHAPCAANRSISSGSTVASARSHWLLACQSIHRSDGSIVRNGVCEVARLPGNVPRRCSTGTWRASFRNSAARRSPTSSASATSPGG